jgi:hypothetical protein
MAAATPAGAGANHATAARWHARANPVLALPACVRGIPADSADVDVRGGGAPRLRPTSCQTALPAPRSRRNGAPTASRCSRLAAVPAETDGPSRLGSEGRRKRWEAARADAPVGFPAAGQQRSAAPAACAALVSHASRNCKQENVWHTCAASRSRSRRGRPGDGTFAAFSRVHCRRRRQNQ